MALLFSLQLQHTCTISLPWRTVPTSHLYLLSYWNDRWTALQFVEPLRSLRALPFSTRTTFDWLSFNFVPEIANTIAHFAEIHIHQRSCLLFWHLIGISDYFRIPSRSHARRHWTTLQFSLIKKSHLYQKDSLCKGIRRYKTHADSMLVCCSWCTEQAFAQLNFIQIESLARSTRKREIEREKNWCSRQGRKKR